MPAIVPRRALPAKRAGRWRVGAWRGVYQAGSASLHALGGGEKVVHGPCGLEALLADECSELRIVAHAVEREVHEDCFAGGTQAAGRDGVDGEFDGPIVIRVGKQAADEIEGKFVCRVKRVDGVLGDLFVGGFGKARESLCVAKLDGNDVLKSVGDYLAVADVAKLKEDCRVGEDEVVPALRGGIVPGNECFGGEGGWHV